jgi:hypothetical protein
MAKMDRIPRLDARTRRAFGGVGADFVPYTGAVKSVDLGAFNLTTTGLGTFGNLDVDTLNFNGNVISDSTGTISFDNEDLITTGKITGLLQMGQNLTPTYTTVQHWSNLTQSASILTGGVISDSGSLEIDVSAATGIIKTTASEIGANVFFNYAGETNVATVADLNFVYLAYVDADNAPTLHTTTDRTTINDQTEILIGWVYNDGVALHIMNCGLYFQDHHARNRTRVRDVYGFERATGIIVSTDATRHVLVTAGTVYRYVCKITTAAFDSTAGGGDTFSYWYRNGSGGWTEVTGQTIINNANYDDGDGVLGALTGNRYGVHWVYVSIDGHVHIIYGRDNYKMAGAEDATPPGDIPDILEHMTILAAKIIVREGTDTTTVASAFDIRFAVTSVDNHNDLGGLQGGAANEYYHFSSANYTDLTDAGDSALHYHATDRARANHTGTQAASTISDFGEAAQNAVGGILDNGTVGNIVFTYNDAGNIISAVTQDGEIDHDALLNFAANEHIDHTAVTLTAGDGLSGGGTIAANRTFAVDLSATPGLEISGAKLQAKVNGSKGMVREAAGIGFEGIYTNTTVNFDASMSADTIQGLIDAEPKYIASGVVLTFQFADGTYTLSHKILVKGFWGSGTVTVQGNMGESGLHTNQAVILDFDGQSCNGIEIEGIFCQQISVYNFHIKIATTVDHNSAIYVTTTRSTVLCHYNYYKGNSNTHGYAVYMLGVLDASMYNNYIDNLYRGIYMSRNVNLFSRDNDDTGTSPQYGLVAFYNATIGKRGTQPAGSVANENTNYGGVIR